MAETYIYDSSTHLTKVRDQTIELNEQANGGSVGQSRLVVEDPSGNTTITGHKTFRVHQSSCSVINVFRGFVTDREYARADAERTTTARHIHLTLIDLNAKLGFKVIRGAAWRKRPKNETIGERLTDMLAASFMNGIHDNGFVTYPDQELDGREDLRGQFPGDVLADMAERVGFNWFVYWDEAAGQASLWFQDSNTSTAWSSTLRISDVASEQDNTTTFGPAFDTKLRRTPERTVSGVWLPYAKGNVYRTREATEENYEPRDGTAPNANAKRRRRARNLGDRYLRQHKTEEDQITTTMTKVPDTRVNLIRAGQRIEAKFTSFTNEGYGDFTWFRVAERTVRSLVAEGAIYDIDLVLAPQEDVSGGGASLVQYKMVTFETDDTITLDDPVTIGNILVASLVKNSEEIPEMPAGAGWTLLGQGNASPGAGEAANDAQWGACAVYAKVATTTDPDHAREPVASRIRWGLYEIAGASLDAVQVFELAQQAVHNVYAVVNMGTFSGSGVAIMPVTFPREYGGAGQTILSTFAAGWTEDYDDYLDPDAFGNPWVAIAHGSGEDLQAAVTATETVDDQAISDAGGVAVLFE